MAIHPDYPLPDVDDPVMRPFWEGCRNGKLLQQRDRRTGHIHWPPKPLYWKGGDRLEWFETDGRGIVYSYVVGYEPFLPAFQDRLPHIMVVVQLSDGARIVGSVQNCTPEEMAFEMPVRVAFERLTDRVTLPVWVPDRHEESR